MLDIYFSPTTNSIKILLFAEEAGLEYRLRPIDITAGEQFAPEFLRIAPNNKVPVIVDSAPQRPGPPIVVWESGAILLYLADKCGTFVPGDLDGRVEVLKWLFWQVAGLGPITGQLGHFLDYAPEPMPYAIRRYGNEVSRLWAVLDRQLAGREYITGEFSIADMACFGYLVYHARTGLPIAEFEHLSRWLERMQARPAVRRTMAQVPSIQAFELSDAQWHTLFGQSKASIRPAPSALMSKAP